MDLHAILLEYWPHIVFVVSLAAGAGAAVHAAMTKQDVRSAIGWVGLTLLSPLFGALIYVVAGINRIRKTRCRSSATRPCWRTRRRSRPRLSTSRRSPDRNSPRSRCWATRSAVSGCWGNAVLPLAGGDEAYPAMLQAIRDASHAVAMQSYIFDNDPIGREMAQALIEAHGRGVQVRVLIDAIGSRYSRPPIVRMLARGGVPVARFMTNPLGVLRMPYANLRSHRKILVVDGRVGFTGGMNVRAAFVTALSGADTNADTHFRLEGPIVTQLMSVFAHDWNFTTHESLPQRPWFDPDAAPAGSIPVRCVPSGPDRALGSTHNMLLGALAVAQRHVRIQSPYFLPDQTLIGALATAAARRGGGHRDSRQEQPAAGRLRHDRPAGSGGAHRLPRLALAWRLRPFQADDGGRRLTYAGSSNLDPRSLRLNFELDTEIYDPGVSHGLGARIDGIIGQARRVTLEDLQQAPFAKRLRNKVIWLATPYL